MKKNILTILILVCVLITAVPNVCADDWYTYTYNFWGDETASPDAYSVANVFYGRDFGEEVGTLNSPEGMFCIDDLVYICDTKNDRILELQYEDNRLHIVRIINTVQVSVANKDCLKDKDGNVIVTLNQPLDIFVKKVTPEERKTVYRKQCENYLGEMYVPEKPVPKQTSDEDADSEEGEGSGEEAGEGDETSTSSEADPPLLGAPPTPDGETPDGETPDGETPDGETPDGETPDGETPDGEWKPVENVVKKDLNRDYDIYIADTENYRIIHCDYQLNVIDVVKDPKDETIKADFKFQPKKFVVDEAFRYYVQAANINAGLMEFSTDGQFSGYIGASPVNISFVKRLWRKIQTKEQRKRTAQYVPTEYNNVAIDNKGFLYVTTSTLSEEELIGPNGKPVRRLNSMGGDILVRNGHHNPIGDLSYGTIGQGSLDGPSRFVDTVSFDNETYCCLDNTRGKLFVYDFQGNMLYAFGNSGTKAGCFNKPVAVDKLNEKSIIVLDKACGTVTIFEMSRYGELVNEALALYRVGRYDDSADVWREVLKYNGNYELGYVGVGRSLLRQGKYKEAMEKFEVVRDTTNYSKAFKYYREQVVEKNIVWFLAIIAALIIIPKAIRTFIRVRKEIKEA